MCEFCRQSHLTLSVVHNFEIDARSFKEFTKIYFSELWVTHLWNIMCICPVNKNINNNNKTKESFYFYLQESSVPLKFQTNPACCPLCLSLSRRSVQRYSQLNLQQKYQDIYLFYVHNNHSQYCKAIANHVDITYA